MKNLSKTKKILIGIALILVLLITGGSMYLYPAYTFFFQTETQLLDKDLTLVLGGGGNSGILVTDKAVVVIDTKMGGDAELFLSWHVKRPQEKDPCDQHALPRRSCEWESFLQRIPDLYRKLRQGFPSERGGFR